VKIGCLLKNRMKTNQLKTSPYLSVWQEEDGFHNEVTHIF
jgi:hypothetical protein